MRALVVVLFCFALAGAAGAREQAKGWLGAKVEDLTAADAKALGQETPHGVKVVARVAGGPAEKAGLEPGDVVLTLDRVEVENKAGFEADLAAKAPGTEIKLGLKRGTAEKRFEVKLAAEPKIATADEKPILQLDTGGHMAGITEVAFTPDSKFIISASADKTIRVWDWRAGKTLRTIRGQSGPDVQGQIVAIALSPDGRSLAVAGNIPGHYIRLYDFASGELKALLKGHKVGADILAFSPDGKKLISGGWGEAINEAIIWDLETKTLLHRLKNRGAEIRAVGFTPDSARAVTGSSDTLRLWNVSDGALITEMAPHGPVFSLAVSPRDGTIASGDWNGEIRLWDGNTGAPIKVFANNGAFVGSLHFSPDGSLLLSTCGNTGCRPIQRIYDAASGKELTTYAKHNNEVTRSAFSPDGHLVATGDLRQAQIYVWDPKTGETKAELKGIGIPVLAVGFSADSRSVAWGRQAITAANRATTLEMALRLPLAGETLSQPEPVKSAEGWVRANVRFGALSLLYRGNPLDPINALNPIVDVLKDGKPTGVSVRGGVSYSFTPDGQQIVSSLQNSWLTLTAYGLDGKRIGDFVGHETLVEAIAPSPDGRFLVSGSADQTVRLWNLKTRELLVTLFRGEDGEWVIWTPQGYYTGSPGADKIVGWQINKGADKAADYVTAEQLRKHLNRPDIVAKAIQLASAEEAVRTSHGTEFKLSDLLARPAPHLRIVSPATDSSTQTPGRVSVKVALEATPDPVTRIRIQVNGRQLDDFLPEGGPSFEPGELEFEVPLAKGKNTIVVTALNEIGWSKVEDGTLTLTNESAGYLDKRGTLYIISIGVTKYPGIAKWCAPGSCDLNYTGNDAIAFAATVERQLGRLHEKVVRRVLVNGAAEADSPTAAHIIDALGVLSDAKPNDTVAVFLAGHGFNDGPNYRFVSTDAADADGKIRPSSIVPWYAIEEAIDQAKGRRLLFVDTCHSAGAYNERLGNTAYYANILAYSSARWDQSALESGEFEHGLFTEALVEALNGEADFGHEGRVDTVTLNAYLQKRVPELAKPYNQEQNPQFFKGRDAEVYTLAVPH